jgi:hypothetical protein
MGKHMKPNFNPKRGDPVRIRLNDGTVIDTTYIEPSNIKKCHRVAFPNRSDDWILCMDDKPYGNDNARFVYPIESMDKPEVRE